VLWSPRVCQRGGRGGLSDGAVSEGIAPSSGLKAVATVQINEALHAIRRKERKRLWPAKSSTE
jgi:hypothetical protein